jgi:hypothetical protein
MFGRMLTDMKMWRSVRYAILAAGLGSGAAIVSGCTSIEGQFIAGGEPLGDDWEMSPERCRSLELEGFFGVRLSSPGQDRVIRLYREAPGVDRVQIMIPDSCDGDVCLAWVLGRDSGCDVFDASLRGTNVYTNDIRHIDGRLALDCHFEDEDGDVGWIAGEVTFTDCH